MKILVTGGAGFIGSHVVDLLVGEAHEVVVLDNLSSGARENVNYRAKFYEEELGNYSRIEEMFRNENFDVVYHLAAQIDVRKSVEEPLEDAKINILGTLNLLELCREFKIKHFIFSSTGGAIYGDEVETPTKEGAEKRPVSPYGCAKLAIENYIHFYHKVHGLKFSILRYGNVYGPRQNFKGEAGVIAVFLNNMLNNKNPVIFGGVQTRDFVYVGDVARANLLALKDDDCGIYNIGTGVEIDIIGIYGKLNRFFSYKFKAEYEEMRKGEQMKSCLDFSKIKKNLGWEPIIGLDDGLHKTYLWFLDRFNRHLN